MKKKSPLKPTRRRTARSLARTAQRQGAKLTPSEALKIGRTTREERRTWRRRLQKRRIAQRQRDKKKAALLAKAKGGLGPVWVRPEEPIPPATVPAGEDYGSRIPSDAEVPMQKQEPRREPAPVAPRRAVRAEPKRGTHGPNRGGESARSWKPEGERSSTKVPVDVADFLMEEF